MPSSLRYHVSHPVPIVSPSRVAAKILADAEGNIDRVDFGTLSDQMAAELISLCPAERRESLAAEITNERYLPRFVNAMGNRLVLSPEADDLLSRWPNLLNENGDLRSKNGRRQNSPARYGLPADRGLVSAADRDTMNYAHDAGPQFIADLMSLGVNDRYFDVGCGYGRALWDFYLLKKAQSVQSTSQATASNIPQILAIDQNFPAPEFVHPHYPGSTSAFPNLAQASDCSLTLYIGPVRDLADLAGEHSGKLRLISDIHGPFQHGPIPFLDLIDIYLSFLTPDGKIYIASQDYQLNQRFEAIERLRNVEVDNSRYGTLVIGKR